LLPKLFNFNLGHDYKLFNAEKCMNKIICYAILKELLIREKTRKIPAI